jgi:hypothetical protein
MFFVQDEILNSSFHYGGDEPSSYLELVQQGRRNLGASGSDANPVIRGKFWIAKASISFYEHDIVIPCSFEIALRIIKRERIDFNGYN